MTLDVLRKKQERVVIGLMSGTSCDGVDAALVRIRGSGPGLDMRLVAFETFPYDSALRARLLASTMDASEVCLLNFVLGGEMAQAAKELARMAAQKGLNADLVASHGHTVAHMPPDDSLGSATTAGTLQIGEAAVIAERTGLLVISDFRPRDIAAGGQGAPLVPYADRLLFGRDDRAVVCLNIGGIANVTVIPPEPGQVMAFDTGPGNMIIDGAARLLTDGALSMDKNGEAASRGSVIDLLNDRLLEHSYFSRRPPKSAGQEQFGAQVYLCPVLAAHKTDSFEDVLATVTAVAARSIASAIQRFVRPLHDVKSLIVSGGGASNRTLMSLLGQELPGMEIVLSQQHGIPGDAREAVAFAILGNETVCGRPANVPSATGASRAVILGKITLP